MSKQPPVAKKRGAPGKGPLALVSLSIRVTRDQRTWLRSQKNYNNLIRQLLWLKMQE